jgi:hypothetical protein
VPFDKSVPQVDLLDPIATKAGSKKVDIESESDIHTVLGGHTKDIVYKGRVYVERYNGSPYLAAAD